MSNLFSLCYPHLFCSSDLPVIAKIYKYIHHGRIQGGAMGTKPPLDQWNLLISGGFQAPTWAEPSPPWKEQNVSPPLDNFLNTPMKSTSSFSTTNLLLLFSITNLLSGPGFYNQLHLPLNWWQNQPFLLGFHDPHSSDFYNGSLLLN